MEAKYEARKQELLEECKVASQVMDRVLSRLERFMDPFVERLVRSEQQSHAHTFVKGLLSDLEHKNVEFTDIPVDANPALRQEMQQRSGRHTVPQIWIGEQHVGGFDDLAQLERQGRFDQLLEQASRTP